MGGRGEGVPAHQRRPLPAEQRHNLLALTVDRRGVGDDDRAARAGSRVVGGHGADEGALQGCAQGSVGALEWAQAHVDVARPGQQG